MNITSEHGIFCWKCKKYKSEDEFAISELVKQKETDTKIKHKWCRECWSNPKGSTYIVRRPGFGEWLGRPSRGLVSVKKRKRLDWLQKRGWRVMIRVKDAHGRRRLYDWGKWKFPVGGDFVAEYEHEDGRPNRVVLRKNEIKAECLEIPGLTVE